MNFSYQTVNEKGNNKCNQYVMPNFLIFHKICNIISNCVEESHITRDGGDVYKRQPFRQGGSDLNLPQNGVCGVGKLNAKGFALAGVNGLKGGTLFDDNGVSRHLGRIHRAGSHRFVRVVLVVSASVDAVNCPLERIAVGYFAIVLHIDEQCSGCLLYTSRCV